MQRSATEFLGVRGRFVPIRLLAGVILLLGLLCGQASAADLASDIAGLLDRPAAERAFWGIKVIDVESGEPVYEYNADQLFVPASSAKLFSTALALASLGPDYRFVTSVVSDARVDKAGVLSGDIVLLGGGDPNLSSRLVPYNSRTPFDRDLMQPITDLARQIAASGVVRVTGDVIGDDSRYVRQSIGVGWSADDGTWGYGAPISALSFNDNLVKLRVMPGSAVGQLARIDLRPDFAYYSVENRVRTTASRNVAQGLQVHREPGSRTVTLWGEISVRSTGRELELAIDEPALFAATALRSELLRLGVEVRGEVRARHAYPHQFDSLKDAPTSKAPVHTTTLARLESRPLADILKVVNKVSQNLHAEMLLREVAYLRRGVGSFDAGLLELKTFLLAAGLKGWEFKLLDASGLSRQNLATPTGMAQLLRHMWASAYKEAYAQSLPLAGEDGTLDWRFSKSPARGRIRAKTGTLTGVTALSGYATAADGRLLAFAIFVNNFGVPASYIRRLVDQVSERLVTAPLDAPLPGDGISGVVPASGTAR